MTHNCGTEHRSYRALVRCLHPKYAWISGEGRYALLAHCDVLTITLHATQDKAERSLRFIDSTRCGGKCTKNHELIQLPVIA